VTREEAHAMWEATKANHARLAACPGPHEFADITPSQALRKRYVCKTCHGEIDGQALHWYAHGLAHGRAYPTAATGR
jgi:hypothetical protein